MPVGCSTFRGSWGQKKSSRSQLAMKESHGTCAKSPAFVLVFPLSPRFLDRFKNTSILYEILDAENEIGVDEILFLTSRIVEGNWYEGDRTERMSSSESLLRYMTFWIFSHCTCTCKRVI